VSGDKLTSLRQDTLVVRGHALECRIYAEDPGKRFLPSPGKLECLQLPAETANVRIDTGVRSGDTITAYYDPMIAKLICWGETRASVLSVAARALSESRIDGISSNIDFLRKVIDHTAFRRGEVFTGFIDAYKTDLIT
ncbi:MAG: acetyl-CoA carboxylase biotin carboxylase subunit, partial [Gammaproteobacteria bacterium]